MNQPIHRKSLSAEPGQPNPGTLYTLDEAAHLAGVPKRSLLIYTRARLIQPVIQPPLGILEFTEEAIYTVRKIEYFRSVHGIELPLVKTIFDLLDEVERLREEVRFLRNR